DEEANYQHVLMNVIGDQLTEMENFSNAPQQYEDISRYTTDRPLALEDVADNLAKKGVRLRIYNRTTAIYKPKSLLPIKKIYCLTSWFTFLAVFFVCAIMCLATIKTDTWRVYLIVLALCALAPIAATISMLANPTRQNKPVYHYKTWLIGALVTGIVVVLLSFGINIAMNIKFSDIGLVATRIFIPSVIGLSLPLAVFIFNKLVDKYSK
ncbi:MAG: hypothetical protein NC350_06220, partial [Corallococcus sp.]|nr:hypothetical protein [Corallococcus sp.]